MKTIPLSQTQKKKNFSLNLFTQVDDEYYDYLMKYKWSAQKDTNTWYAVGNVDGKTNKMHRVIMGIINPKVLIDHIDGNGLNNQINNLRIATIGQNVRNRRKVKGKTSKYLGVCIIKNCTGDKRYLAQIKSNKIIHRLGTFPHSPCGELLAALSYDFRAKELHGEFANLNFK